MTTNGRQRKVMLTVHVASSVGWIGAVASFLALAITGLTSTDMQMVRSAYLAMELTGWMVIVPFSIASLLSGLVQSLGTTWGLFRHYWVIFKLAINLVASFLLVLHMQPVGQIAKAAAHAALTSTDLRGIRIQVAFDAGAAGLVLLVAAVLGIYKPQGLTPHGWRKRFEAGR